MISLLPNTAAQWRRSALAWLVVVTLAAAFGLLAYRVSEHAGQMRLAELGLHQLDLYSASLKSELGKYEALPGVLEQNEDVVQLLQHADDRGLRDKVDRELLNLNVRIGSLGIVILDAAGSVLASSNWYRPQNMIGQDKASADFFGETMRAGQTLTFVVGSSRGDPECYLARAISRGERTLGVVAVRISLEATESSWVELAVSSESEKVLVIDEHGIVIMSSKPEWRYRSIAPIDAGERAALAASGRYPPGALRPLPFTLVRNLEYGTRLVHVGAPQAPADVEDGVYVSEEEDLARPGWRLMTLSQVMPITREARRAAVGGASAGALLGVGGLYVLLRRRAIAHRLQARAALERMNDQLEQRVAERTCELVDANCALQQEVAERKRTEASLRAAQDELLQAGRLALLGKMSAAITHEINQPLTALRAMSDNGTRLLEAGRLEDVAAKFHAIAQVTERMGRITSQLKSFARKTVDRNSVVRLGGAVANVVELLRSRLHEEGVVVSVDVPGCLRVACEGYRLEQVLLNLMGNALDAMKDLPERRLIVQARREGDRLHVSVEDTGGGIPEAIMSRLFEPFCTTKPPGQGLGLGLVLSREIVREFGGTLRVRNASQGALFEFDLKVEEDEGVHAK
jgi:two-component system C4-dicarboxylate transport sensor histidine kinase DctB